MPTIGRTVKPLSIDDIPADMEPRMREVLEAIIYAIDLREGRVAKGTNSRFVTIQDLVAAGVVADGVIK